MKNIFVFVLAIVATFAFAAICPPTVCADGQNDIVQHKQCKHCGMSRENFDYSRMLIEYSDGTVVPVCSLHCAATDLASNIDKSPKSIMVGDFSSKQLIDAEKATWVIGGKRPGVMSKKGKWAFENAEDAKTFLKTNEGTIASFDEALKMAYSDMADDTKMIRERRQSKNMKMMEEPKGHDGH